MFSVILMVFCRRNGLRLVLSLASPRLVKFPFSPFVTLMFPATSSCRYTSFLFSSYLTLPFSKSVLLCMRLFSKMVTVSSDMYWLKVLSLWTVPSCRYVMFTRRFAYCEKAWR